VTPRTEPKALTKTAIRSLKSLLRDRNERELFRHEYAALSELKKLRLVNFVGDEMCVTLTKKGRRIAAVLSQKIRGAT